MYVYKKGVCFLGFGVRVGVQIKLFHQNGLCSSANSPHSSARELQFANAVLLSSIHFRRAALRISLSSASSRVAERFISKLRALLSKLLFMLKFVAFLGAALSYISRIVGALCALCMRITYQNPCNKANRNKGPADFENAAIQRHISNPSFDHRTATRHRGKAL